VREDVERTPKLFYAAVAERRMKRSLVREFVRRVFGGSDESMIMHALKDDSATPEEIDELRRRLKDLRGKSS
jgi:predicted transcriptional regulator